MSSLLAKQLAVRGDLTDRLVGDLFGPGRESTEEITEAPLDRFLTGILYPRLDDADVIIDQLGDDVGDDDTTGGPDPAVAMSNLQYPSSAGVTCAVDPDEGELSVKVHAARYEKLEVDDGERWRRVPLGPLHHMIPLEAAGTKRAELTDGLILFWTIRPQREASRSVTVVLVNDLIGKAGEKDHTCFFQVELELAGGASTDAFVARPAQLDIDDEDMQSNALLFRDVPEFAVGHGCAAEWDVGKTSVRASRVRVTFAPSYEVEIMESSPEIPTDRLTFKAMAELGSSDLEAELRAFASGYEAWIGKKRRAALELSGELRATADEHLEECEEAHRRILEGVSLLGRDSRALLAFQLANRAMREQMLRGQEGEQDEPTWRPFQLAFILISIPSLVDAEHEARALAELLWFPTGGGKTEAYLGLFAFATFHRRLTRGGQPGVTALMRYTLRLLTTQQFERAARVVCACEVVRLGRSDLGDEPISIGLFVGSASTPNDLKAAKSALNALRAGKQRPTENPCQLKVCPWCSAPLSPAKNYGMREKPHRLHIECRNPGCEFEKGLPIFVVDEDLFREKPTLVIGTIDKFAGLPWRPAIGNLFNLDDPDLDPPDLIIQDELHLISGPLGTLAGLYETAIDLLCEGGGKAPKVVASTATIRRAKAQSLGLFAKDVRQFPPPGLEPGDNWFATRAPSERVGSRKYFGLMAPGASHAILLIRTYAALLDGAVRHECGPAVDPYRTLIGYFNSLRVLGAARMQVQDDVQDALATLNPDQPRRVRDPIELTSRADSTDIPEYLKRLEEDCGSTECLDVVLATNMIQVGVDVDRLGLMVVMGQPQAAAEYIQATSRVGRKHPGLVVTLFNSARSRDRSHYEGFVGFHSSMYRSVEATSVTPFSARARDRGLHAVLVALARLEVPGLRENPDAANIGNFESELEAICDRIVERAERAGGDDGRGGTGEVRAELIGIVEEWRGQAAMDPGLVYESWKGDKTALLTHAGPEAEGGDSYPTMWSLRDVDVESNLYFGKVE